jgi:hypothetical protein
MTVSDGTHRLGKAGIRGVLESTRRHLGGRRSLWLVAGLVLAAGLALNWDWLVAAGIAPVIVTLLPCAAMCVLGLCAHKVGAATLPSDDEPGGDRAS